MVAVNTHLEFVVHTVKDGSLDTFLNVFNYRVLNVTDPFTLADQGANLAEAWEADFGPVWAPIIHAAYRLTSIEIYDLTNELDFYVGSFETPFQGGTGGQPMPQFNAWAFKLNRTSRLTRNGAKRFPGVPEDLWNDNAPAIAAVAPLAALAAYLGNVISLLSFDGGDNDILLGPEIKGKPILGDDPVFNDCNSAQFRTVSTQNTRKQGRGS